jgi:uroporphyrin-III C-methyltransferase
MTFTKKQEQMNTFKQTAIVGVGPGHPDHMTKRAIDYINQADVLLYDCLVDEVTLTIIPASVQVIRVDKTFRKSNGMDIFEQPILKEMEKWLSKGKKIVRIKPGNSMNYNSGGMEADYLISKGYEVEMVPGIPTDMAAADLLRINLTEIAQSNGFMSFMADELKKDAHLLPHLAYLIEKGQVPLCLYGMTPERFSVVATSLMDAGVSTSMTVAVCGDVSLDSMSLIKTDLGSCASLMELLAAEEAVPGHFIVFIGRYIVSNYVDFKRMSTN